MSIITVRFLGKDYSIPEDILVYIDLLDFTNSVQKQLMSVFSRKLQNTDVGCIGDDDMADEIRSQVNRFIGKLCDQGIYNRTVNDYLNGNKGYQLISKVNDEAFQKAKALLMQKLETFEAGYEDALNKAEGSITGMGFSIWSGSFVNHAIYAAMQASTINKQAKAAEVEYQRDMAALTSRMDAQYDGEQRRYIKNEYIPHMESALTAFVYELLDRYLSDLISNHKFNPKALEHVDIKRSNDLLDNLKLSENKRAILETAFVACPYNLSVYLQTMKYDLLDYDTFQTAKIFKLDKLILSSFKENWGEVSFPKKFNINYRCINSWASLAGKPSAEILCELTNQYASDVVTAYARIANLMADESACHKIVAAIRDDMLLSDESICSRKARKYVEPIVPMAIWEQLTQKCGHTDLLGRIKAHFPFAVELQTKKELDECIIAQLTSKFEEIRKELTQQIRARQVAEEHKRIERERKKAEQERIQAEKKASKKRKKAGRRKILKIVFPPVIILVLALLIIPQLSNGNKTYVDTTDYNTTYDWPDRGLAVWVPQPTIETGKINNNHDTMFDFYVFQTAEADYLAYINECRINGYTDVDEESETCYGAYNETGDRHVKITYYAEDSKIYVVVRAPEQWADIYWPKSELGKSLPEPNSLYGVINWDDPDSLDVDIANVTQSDFNNYVDACIAAGYNIDYTRYDDYFRAENTDGYELYIRYEYFDVMNIDADMG